jgi:hypothetical protein
MVGFEPGTLSVRRFSVGFATFFLGITFRRDLAEICKKKKKKKGRKQLIDAWKGDEIPGTSPREDIFFRKSLTP